MAARVSCNRCLRRWLVRYRRRVSPCVQLDLEALDKQVADNAARRAAEKEQARRECELQPLVPGYVCTIL